MLGTILSSRHTVVAQQEKGTTSGDIHLTGKMTATNEYGVHCPVPQCVMEKRKSR